MKCIIQKCESNAYVRGLCQTCYSATRRLINMGLIDEDDWQGKGFILPRKNKNKSNDESSEEKYEYLCKLISDSIPEFVCPIIPNYLSDSEHHDLMYAYMNEHGKIVIWDQYKEALGIYYNMRSKKQHDAVVEYLTDIDIGDADEVLNKILPK